MPRETPEESLKLKHNMDDQVNQFDGFSYKTDDATIFEMGRDL